MELCPRGIPLLLGFFQVLFQLAYMSFPFAQHVPGRRQIEQRRSGRKRLGRTNRQHVIRFLLPLLRGRRVLIGILLLAGGRIFHQVPGLGRIGNQQARHVVLQQNRAVRKNSSQHVGEFRIGKFPFMKRINLAAILGVVKPVGSGNQQQARRSQNPPRFLKETGGVREVFDDLKGDNQIELRGDKRQGVTIRLREQNFRRTVVARGVFNGLSRNIHAGYAGCILREQGRAVSGAAGHVKDSLPGGVPGSEQVAGPVLVEQIGVHFARDHSFPSKIHRFSPMGPATGIRFFTIELTRTWQGKWKNP